MLENLTEERVSHLVDWLLSSDEDPPYGISEDKISVARQLCERLFLPTPMFERDDEHRDEAFDRLIDEQMHQASSVDLSYTLPYPKWQFLYHLTARRGFLFHGSRRSLGEVVPSSQTDWSGRVDRSVFATTDPILAIFFAIIRRDVIRSIRNGGFLIESSPGVRERFYFFSVQEANEDLRQNLLADGFVHVLQSNGFTTSDASIRFDEWHHSSKVPVLMRLAVSPEDFPFRESITKHGDESVVSSWLQYKARLDHGAGY